MDYSNEGDGENDRHKVHVLTAGGVASATTATSPSSSSSSRNKKKKHNKKKQAPQEQYLSPAVVVGEREREREQASSAAVTSSTFTAAADDPNEEAQNDWDRPEVPVISHLEIEEDDWDSPQEDEHTDALRHNAPYVDDPKDELAVSSSLDSSHSNSGSGSSMYPSASSRAETVPTKTTTHADNTDTDADTTSSNYSDVVWLTICFLGIMASFVCYGLLLEYTTSGGRNLHELSFLFVTSGLYTLTAAAGRYVRDETPSTIPPARFALLGLTSMGSTFCSVRSLRYVIYPIQVLAKSCKPVPVMLMGAAMGKVYPARKYANVVMIVLGVALFMGAGTDKKNSHASASDGDDADSDSDNESNGSPSQIIGIVLLFVSLCFDGGTGAYEDKLMSVHSVQPFDLMYNIQLGKTILAFIGLLVLNQLHIFIQMVQEMGFLLVALGLSGALGQVFIFVTIAKFGALTCSIIGLARKVTTLVASIYFYGHHLNSLQFTGLMISVTAMVLNFLGKKGGGGEHGDGHGHGGAQPTTQNMPEEMQKMLDDEAHDDDDDNDDDDSGGDVELAASPKELV